MISATPTARSADPTRPTRRPTLRLPITKGLQESIHDFQGIDQEVELRPILDQLAARPPLDLSLGEEVEARLPAIVGGLSVALARTFGIIDPNLKNPRTEQWERAFCVFNLLL